MCIAAHLPEIFSVEHAGRARRTEWLAAVAARGLLSDIETLHLDRGYDSNVTRERGAAARPGSST